MGKIKNFLLGTAATAMLAAMPANAQQPATTGYNQQPAPFSKNGSSTYTSVAQLPIANGARGAFIQNPYVFYPGYGIQNGLYGNGLSVYASIPINAGAPKPPKDTDKIKPEESRQLLTTECLEPLVKDKGIEYRSPVFLGDVKQYVDYFFPKQRIKKEGGEIELSNPVVVYFTGDKVKGVNLGNMGKNNPAELRKFLESNGIVDIELDTNEINTRKSAYIACSRITAVFEADTRIKPHERYGTTFSDTGLEGSVEVLTHGITPPAEKPTNIAKEKKK